MAKMTDEKKAERALARKRADALAAEEVSQRGEAKRREWVRTGAYLTYAEYLTGVPCRGCGEPLRGEDPPYAGKGSRAWTDEERAARDAEQAAFMARHPDCKEGSWGISGCATLHCHECCPPPPMSQKTRDKIATIFGQAGDLPDYMKIRWLLTFTCGHTRETTAHSDHKTYAAVPRRCEECGEIRGVVGTENLGPLAEKPKPPVPPSNREKSLAKVEAARAALLEAERVLAMLEDEVKD